MVMAIREAFHVEEGTCLFMVRKQEFSDAFAWISLWLMLLQYEAVEVQAGAAGHDGDPGVLELL